MRKQLIAVTFAVGLATSGAALLAQGRAGGVAVAAGAMQVTPASLKPGDQGRRLGAGYLPTGAAPDSLAFLPLPPASRSPAMARDEAASRAGLGMRGSPRWDQAAIDAVLFATGDTTNVFSCAAGITINAQNTPKLNALLRKAGPDLGMAVYPAKRKYMRARPFMVNHQPTCTPRDEAVLRTDGSYPSGHAAIGWGWGLLLAELIPDRSSRLVARGRAFADSRRICNVHWLSDTEEGGVVASAVVARLHAEPAFLADMAAARQEIVALTLAEPDKPDCTRENAALGTSN
jgi:acid phosphatase (class A)